MLVAKNILGINEKCQEYYSKRFKKRLKGMNAQSLSRRSVSLRRRNLQEYFLKTIYLYSSHKIEAINVQCAGDSLTLE